MPLYNIGDIVKIRPDLVSTGRIYRMNGWEGMHRDYTATPDMVEFAGAEAEIIMMIDTEDEGSIPRGYEGLPGYRISVGEKNRTWMDEMFSGLVHECAPLEESDMPLDEFLRVWDGDA